MPDKEGRSTTERLVVNGHVIDGDVAALGWCEVVDDTADRAPEPVDGSFCDLAQEGFELDESVLNRIEVGPVGER
jgi:hypothetical protein